MEVEERRARARIEAVVAEIEQENAVADMEVCALLGEIGEEGMETSPAGEPSEMHRLRAKYDEFRKLMAYDSFERVSSSKRGVTTVWVESGANDGEVKARLCVRGFEIPKHCLERNFAPTPLGAHLKVVLVRAQCYGHRVQLGDVSRAFLHAPLSEPVVVQPPKEWFEYLTEQGEKAMPDEKWLAVKAIYGLRQAPREWDEHFAEVMAELESFKFMRLVSEPSVWFEHALNIIVVKYVDDLMVAGPGACVEQFYKDLGLRVAILPNPL